ncbi:hypothetical protein HUJ04_009365 [Dendroctonus ponderosae]|nr:hypothetical protein HUJ04_009365 [Dendroctonus ponderosae]
MFMFLMVSGNGASNSNNGEANVINNQVDDSTLKASPYVPGDLTEPHHRPPSYHELSQDRFRRRKVKLLRSVSDTWRRTTHSSNVRLTDD